MTNLRILSVDVIDSTTINAKFTDNLDSSIGASNISIESQVPNVPSPSIIATDITGDTITITTQPLTPQVAYVITFQSVPGILFKSVNGTSILYQDGVTNKYLIIGPIESDNVVQQFLQNYLKDNIYKIEDNSTVVSKIIQSLSILLSKALYDIRQVKNENYISFTVNDEQKVRGAGPFDRLLEESAYQVIRVGKNPTGAASLFNLHKDDFPSFPVSLLSEVVVSEIILPSASSENEVGSFNINNFILTVNNKNVSKLTSVTFYYTDGRLPYVYEIESLGYQILNSRYDQDFGFSYALLEIDQFKISESILNDTLFSTQNIFNVIVNYEYRNLGRIIDSSTVEVTTVLRSVRETLPPIINVFNLEHAPITDSSGNLSTVSGVTFIDPNAISQSIPHPAFTNEIPYNLSALPYAPGQYSVDYSTGTVYVYGEDLTNSGTGPFPPLATYSYLHTYKSSTDYTYDDTTNDLVALPFGNLVDNDGTVSFNYEQVLIPGIDYNSNTHIEVLSERIENRLLALNVLSAENSPITNVFRIFNETSGEIYGITRWSGNKIYFTYNTPPNVKQAVAERVTFNSVLNETLFVNNEFTNASSLRIFKCLLSTNKIISKTEDSLGSSINSSVGFSNANIFVSEKWFDGSGVQTESQNVDKLQDIGEYQIDYLNGIVYVAVSSTQDINLGTISYKEKNISPINTHVISVDDIYYRVSLLNPKDKQFQYDEFTEGSITPSSFDNSDEAFLNEVVTSPYQVFNGEIGSFVSLTFVPGLTSNLKFIRGVFEFDDLQNNTNPLNFSEAVSINNTIINIGSIEREEFSNILFDGSDYYVNVNLNLPYLSPNITFTISVVRNSDNAQLWDSLGEIVVGDPVKFVLSGTNTPQEGEAVTITYSITINNLSRIIVDYNRGEYYVDYTYLADEIVISYEYGDNLLDFRESRSLALNEQYYATYKVGALRDALLKNFGTLINVPELAVFDVDLDRERYRDAVTGALESFIIGPTITAMKTLVQAITHIEPEIIESVFQNWSLGSSLLNPRGIETEGEFELIPAKYGNGVRVDTVGQEITFPISSNLKLEEGSFQSWVLPDWDGIDNEVPLTITVTDNGLPVKSNFVFVGAGEYHPEYDQNNAFTIDKSNNIFGTPNKNKDGVFVYYDFDSSGLYKKWFCDVVDGYADGYNDGYIHNYSIKFNTPGLFYNVKSSTYPQPSNVSITSGLSHVTFRINSSEMISEGISFIADREHYLLDFGRSLKKERLSIFKDPSGYLNFRVFDNQSRIYTVSADISNWKAHELHHVAASWKINTKNYRDELHLFIDGFEVPNIIKYGNKVGPYLHEKFRTINPEEIAGAVTKNIVGSIDLVTTLGSPTVSSSLNFSAYGISPGDTIYIDEIGFNTAGYTILSENGNTLVLDTNMPATLIEGRFSVNRVTIDVVTEIDVYNKIAVSTISSIYTSNNLVTTTGLNTVTSATDFSVLGVQAGYLIRIDDTSFEDHYVILDVSGTTLTVNDNLPVTLSSLTYYIYRNDPVEIPGPNALRPSYTITQDSNYQNQIILSNSISANDLILITTFGLNHKRVRQKFYQWDSGSNVIKTRMAPPIDLNTVAINHVLLSTLAINSSNSTILLGVLTSNPITTEQPSISDNGRTIAVTISSTNNITFPLTVTITGAPTPEVLTFNELGTQNTVNKFTSITNVVVVGTPINVNRNFITLTIKEAYPITTPENSTEYPIVRYSYQTRYGTTLSSPGGSEVTDLNGFFSSLNVGNYLIINSPVLAAGTYQISEVSSDHKSATIVGTLPAFSDGYYELLNATTYRNGFQNGYFILEKSAEPGQPYLLNSGFYEFDFYTYLTLKFDPLNVNAYVGTDLNGLAHFNGTIDEMKITSIILDDTRVGESTLDSEETITKDYNSLKEQVADVNTLVLTHFNTFPFTNVAPFYITAENKDFVQSGQRVNDDFSQSLFITDKPLVIENDGILDSKREGTIEFWVNPLYDTSNDPNYRYYFDASGVKIEKVTSLDYVTVQTAGRIGRVISVTLQSGDPSVDYFAGGKVEISSIGAIAEPALSTNASTVTVSKNVLQVVTVKIVGDPTNTDYFAGGNIGTDKRTLFLGRVLPQSTLPLVVTYKPADGSSQTLNSQVIRLNKRLPNQNMPVIVKYVPSGLNGDRITIFKDPEGYINFALTVSGLDYVVRAPAYWARGTWHRIRASYSVNGGRGTDTIRLFMDGYERGNVLVGTGLVFGDPAVFGSTFAGDGSGIQTTINFKDFLDELYIGTDYAGEHGAFALIDNLRISNIARAVFQPFGESIDVNYNSNLSVVFPVTTDLYTTLLLDFETLLMRNQDFVTLTNKKSGIFDFSINIFDSFGIVNSSAKVQEVLETLINILKPANSRVFLKYIR